MADSKRPLKGRMKIGTREQSVAGKSRKRKTSEDEVKITVKKRKTETPKKGERSPRPSGRKKSAARRKLKQEASDEESDVQKKRIKTEKKTTKHGRCSGRKLVGAHVSIQGGLDKAVIEAVEIGARSIGMFLKSQRQWAAKPMEDKVAEKFRNACKTHGFSPDKILPHGSYLINCASPNKETLKKSRDALIDELQRCERLGLTLYNFHPGSTCGEITVEQGIANIAQSINMAHTKTKYVTTVIENMCCQGNTIGGKFEELRGIINKVKDKSRIGVCLDTCHAFAAGFDLTTDAGYKRFIADFGKIIGFKYLKGVHLNDSKGKQGCHQDRHENIGKGYIGLDSFHRVMTDPHFNNIPMILETPGGFGYDKEIQILHQLC